MLRKHYAVAALILAPICALAQAGGTIPQNKTLPPPSESVKNFSKVKGWDDGRMPQAPPGFEVTLYKDGFSNPRWLYQLPNGDILVAESNTIKNTLMQAGAVVLGAAKAENMKTSANRISILRDADKDGKPEIKEIFMENLNQPFGMLLLNGWLYVGNTDGLIRVPYKEGDMRASGPAETIVKLPAEGRNQHWTRNIVANADGSKIYIAVGSNDNIGANGKDVPARRACILEINPDGTGERVYGSGLRNPVGMAWAPGTKTLWTAVNERDELGDELVPDYLTSVKPGGFYGWPWSYYGQNEDPRMEVKRPDLVKKAIVPDVQLGSHTASLGLVFYNGARFPSKYKGGAFITQHGSWNRKVLSGYKVVYVPFKGGKPSGAPEDFLTGFKPSETEEENVYGRPVGILELQDGSLLITDDVNDRIWRVAAR
jgi:glucose/arabinose dehydrogenase